MTGSAPGCVLASVPWIRTSSGAVTVRDALIGARSIEGLDAELNGIETGATLRFLTAVVALVVREQDGPGTCLEPAAVDIVIARLSPFTDLYEPELPFLQLPVGRSTPKVSSETLPKKLLPWMPAHRAEAFWSGGAQASTLDPAAAALALAVHFHYSFGGNNRLDGLACVNGSPGIRYLGVGFTATEVLWLGPDLLATLLMNTPKSWIEGTGLPAWADRACVASRPPSVGRPEHPLWRASWGSNTARCRWDDGRLTAVSIGGSPHRPPTMGTEKADAKRWWDLRNTEDSFYLYRDVEQRSAAGVVTRIERKAQRLDLGHAETDLAVEWNAKDLSSDMRSRSRGSLRTPGREARIMFLRHLVEGSASSPVVRRTEVMISSQKKWMIDVERAATVSSASEMLRRVRTELCKPFSDRGTLTMLRDRRTDIETEFWHRVSRPFEDFIIHGSGAELAPAVFLEIRTAALAAFDEVTASSPLAKLAPLIWTARRRVAWNISRSLGLIDERSATLGT